MHRLEGLHLARQMLEGFLETEDMAAASMQSLVNGLSAMLEAGVTEKALADFEANAFAALKRTYQMMEPPIVAKLVKSQFLGATQLPTTQQPHTNPVPETQSPPQHYYTQAAATSVDAASIEDISQFSALPAVLPASSQLAPPIKHIPFEVYGMIMKAGDRTEDIFDEADETIERSMNGYLGSLRLRMEEVQKGLARISESVKQAEGKLTEPSTLFAISTNPGNWERYQKFERLSSDLTAELYLIHDAVAHNERSSGNDYTVFAKYIDWLKDYGNMRSEVCQVNNLGRSQPKPTPVEKVMVAQQTAAPLPANVTLHPVAAEAPAKKEKKRLIFDDDEEGDEDGKGATSVVVDKKKSMLLPNGTAKKIQWDEHEAENTPVPHPNSSSQDAPLRIAKPPKSAILPSSSQASAPEAPKHAKPNLASSNQASKQPSKQVSKPGSPPPEQPLVPCSSLAPTGASTGAPTIQKQKGRRSFSEQETRNLVEGLRRFGRKWAIILATYEFNDRTQVDLKDKARNLEKAGLIVLPPSSK
jgi:hypothetical protein